MKKTIIASIVGVLAAVFICAASVWTFNGTFPWDKEAPLSEANVDSLVQLSIKDVVDPTFYSVEEVMVYRNLDADQKRLDSTFYAMPDNIVEKVAGVLINRDGAACKRSIVLEYNANKGIFDNLPDAPVADTPQNQSTSTSEPVASISLTTEGKTTVTEGQPTRVVSESVKDTTIDGKVTRITTKVEQHE
jgi:hypothetical protein